MAWSAGRWVAVWVRPPPMFQVERRGDGAATEAARQGSRRAAIDSRRGASRRSRQRGEAGRSRNDRASRCDAAKPAAGGTLARLWGCCRGRTGRGMTPHTPDPRRRAGAQGCRPASTSRAGRARGPRTRDLQQAAQRLPTLGRQAVPRSGSRGEEGPARRRPLPLGRSGKTGGIGGSLGTQRAGRAHESHVSSGAEGRVIASQGLRDDTPRSARVTPGWADPPRRCCCRAGGEGGPTPTSLP